MIIPKLKLEQAIDDAFERAVLNFSEDPVVDITDAVIEFLEEYEVEVKE